MSTDPTDDPRTAAIEQLEQFGLSTYAARTFVALVGLTSGTAADVSRVAQVPRTRVYDAVEELQERGLVDIKQTSPREFRAVSGRTAVGHFEHDLQNRIDVLRTALDELAPRDPYEEQRGVWTVDGKDAITDRVLSFLEDAETEIVYMTVEELLTDRLVTGLREASSRNVTLRVGGVSNGVGERIRTAVPEAEPFESLWTGADTPAGRLLMVDGKRTLVSVLAEDDTSDDGRTETAIWGVGEANGLVVVLRAMFTWRLRADETDSSHG